MYWWFLKFLIREKDFNILFMFVVKIGFILCFVVFIDRNVVVFIYSFLIVDIYYYIFFKCISVLGGGFRNCYWFFVVS